METYNISTIFQGLKRSAYFYIVAKEILFSIGHGVRKAEDLLALLRQYDIQYLIDVRTVPYSRFNPQYRQSNLQPFLESNDIRYVYMGDTLGGRPKDPSCYDDTGRIDYTIVATKEFFKQGIERLKNAYNSDANVAIMCSETKPSHCHRCHLIGKALITEHIILQHIDEHGQLKDQLAVISEIKKNSSSQLLFK